MVIVDRIALGILHDSGKFLARLPGSFLQRVVDLAVLQARLDVFRTLIM